VVLSVSVVKVWLSNSVAVSCMDVSNLGVWVDVLGGCGVLSYPGKNTLYPFCSFNFSSFSKLVLVGFPLCFPVPLCFLTAPKLFL
jgi:hypothetical protein